MPHSNHLLLSQTRCDLHLHSSASTANDEWYSRSFGCPESYASPVEQYVAAKQRGMSLVTLTDHDTIAGGLELVDRPDFFLSEEVTTQFPDGCVIHVLAWNITPPQHDRIQAVRGNVHELVDYLREAQIAHACAHPLFAPNTKLTVATLEQILVMFPVLEGTNGLTDRRLERDLLGLLDGVDDAVLTTLATRYELARPTRRHGGHILTAGSDAHTLRHCATAYTAVPSAGLDPVEFFAAVSRGDVARHGRQADLNVMHLTAERVTYGFLAARRDENPTYRDPFVDLIDVVSGRETGAAPPTGMRDEFVKSLLLGAARTATPLGALVDPHAIPDHDTDDADARVMAAIRGVHDGLIGHAFDELVDGLGDLDLYRLLGGARDLAGAIATAAPFLFAAHHYAKQCTAGRDVLARWTASPRPPQVRRLAIFSDSLEQVDGVTSSLRRFVRRATADGCEVRIPYCGTRPPDDSHADVYVPLASTTTRATDLYEGMQFYLPSLLGTIDWLWRHDITNVELATPGPMGLVGLFAARLLKLPVTASYHTEVPDLVRQLSDSAVLQHVARSLVGWFYGAADRVFAFSESSRQRLIALGVNPTLIEYAPVAIDPDEFSPAHACTSIYPSFGVAVDRPIVLSVGRLSREKNLPLVIDAVSRLQHLERPPTLVIVGDGPDAGALRASCANRPWIVFAGLQEGATLRQLYASATVFAFASTIDTLGLVGMEAMASGLPVLVPSTAAIAELVTHGRTGYCYEPSVDGLAALLDEVLATPHHRGAVGRSGRDAMIERWQRTGMADIWQSMAGSARGA